jgi:hypothetical protein
MLISRSGALSPISLCVRLDACDEGRTATFVYVIRGTVKPARLRRWSRSCRSCRRTSSVEDRMIADQRRERRDDDDQVTAGPQHAEHFVERGSLGSPRRAHTARRTR